MHPYFSQTTQVANDRAHGITTEAWSPLERANDLLKHEVVIKIAAQLKRLPAQIILRWHHQLGVIPIPKASSDERQKQNLSLFDFELDAAAMDQIGSLNRPNGRLANQDSA